MTDNPHFAHPFNIQRQPDGHVGADTVEQDTDADVRHCVGRILRTPRGWRDELPGFGVTDQAFTRPTPDELLRQVAPWESRRDLTADDLPTTVDRVHEIDIDVGRARTQ